jgi:23S rRNA (adenine2503-C2)-methyltransferase
MVVALSGMSDEQLESLAVQLGHPGYRGRQIFEAIHRNNRHHMDDLTSLPSALRSSMDSMGARVHGLEELSHQISQDGTVKMALGTSDGRILETVLIPMDDGTFTQCLSSQTGCAMGCRFCMTATLGAGRDLLPAEILDQHLLSSRFVPLPSIRNLVFMGMGEPLLNFDSVRDAVALLQHPRGRGYSSRRITVSTSGIIPGIRRAGTEMSVLLAVSLNAPTQELREQLMPIARKYPLQELLAALKQYPLAPRQRHTIEYVLLGGVNDQEPHARDLVRTLSFLKCKVNLIPFNPFPGSSFAAPSADSVLRFRDILYRKGFTVTIRQSKGADIDAACGQLAGRCQGRDEVAPETDSRTQRT